MLLVTHGTGVFFQQDDGRITTLLTGGRKGRPKRAGVPVQDGAADEEFGP